MLRLKVSWLARLAPLNPLIWVCFENASLWKSAAVVAFEFLKGVDFWLPSGQKCGFPQRWEWNCWVNRLRGRCLVKTPCQSCRIIYQTTRSSPADRKLMAVGPRCHSEGGKIASPFFVPLISRCCWQGWQIRWNPGMRTIEHRMIWHLINICETEHTSEQKPFWFF